MSTVIEFAEGMTLKAKFVSYAKYCIEGGYQFSSDTRTQLSGLFHCIENTNQGAVVYGKTGTGKTILFQMLGRIIHPKDPLAFKFRNSLDIVLDFNITGHEIFNKDNSVNVLIDDLGAEDKGVHFGDRVEVFERYIQKRYDLWKLNGVRTYFTTNMTPEKITERYGTRVWSRLEEMCQHFLINDSDKRNLKNFKSFPTVLHRKTKDEQEWDRLYKEHKEQAKLKEYKQPPTLGERLKNQFKESFGEFE